MWDAYSGNLVLVPFEGRIAHVNSIAFSSAGQYIASGSQDKTIRVWDAHTGSLVSGLFEGHAGWVRSIAFSFDGKYIASGSDDKTMRVWDAPTGNLVSGPFEGHTDWVKYVAFFLMENTYCLHQMMVPLECGMHIQKTFFRFI